MDTSKNLYKIVTPTKTVTVETNWCKMTDIVDVFVKLEIECVIYNEDETVFYDSSEIKRK